MGQPTKLNPTVQSRILDHIRSGAYEWVAAQACGITPQTFGNWMRWGKSGNPTYLSFFAEVSEARAQARVVAESATYKSNPFAWLRYGPGRERPNEPGWTESRETKSEPIEAAVATISRREVAMAIEELEMAAQPGTRSG